MRACAWSRIGNNGTGGPFVPFASLILIVARIILACDSIIHSGDVFGFSGTHEVCFTGARSYRPASWN